MQATFAQLLEKASQYLEEDKVLLLRKAYDFAANAHEGQMRKSGEPYLSHPLQTASYLADLQLDADTLVAALLHDVPEDCGVAMEGIEASFGTDVRNLVDGVTKLTKLSWYGRDGASGAKKPDEVEAQAENLRKMLLAMAQDVRVVLIKLADRLHNMKTLAALPPEKRLTMARQTMEIYAPLAHRLGIWQMKWQLEDLAFQYLDPARYKEVAHLIASRRAVREKYIAGVTEVLKKELEKVGIEAEVSGRPKHIYSIYRKMEKYAEQGKSFSEIYDLLAVRVLVKEVQDCYSALGIIHSLWPPVPGQFDDYIAVPKERMYHALHTTVMCQGARPLEIQIRTYEMHRVAEYGIAAHWRYKEGGKPDARFDEKIAWLRRLLEWQKEVMGALEFVEILKTDMFRDQVYVFTPKGEVRDLPAEATPIDFAYRIHTDLGHKCIGARVNGKLVPLDTRLNSGDIVEIVTSRSAKGPSLDWLNPNLGYVKTSHARDKIRQWFKKQQRADNIAHGKEILHKELGRLGLEETADEEVAKLFKYDKVEDFLAALGYGEINSSHIVSKLVGQQEQREAYPSLREELPAEPVFPGGVEVMGVGDLLTQLARCCRPVPGDDITGYVTRSRGVTVHRSDCRNILAEDEKERLVEVRWGRQRSQLYPVQVRIEAWDRVGLMRDITTVVSEEKLNLSSVSTKVHPDYTATVLLTVETSGVAQLSRVLAKLESVRGIVRVARQTGVTAPA